MSYYKIVLDLIENMVEKDEELEGILKQTDVLHRENIELKKQVEGKRKKANKAEKELEAIRLRSQTIDYIVDNFKGFTALMNPANQDMTPYIRLKRNLEKIDFSKILRGDLIDVERNYYEKCQNMKDQLARHLGWKEKMKQRNIVQQYYQANTALNEAKEIFEKETKSLQKSLQESQNITNAAYVKRNMLIVALIDGSKELRSAQEEHHHLIVYKNNLERLQERKLELKTQLNNLSISFSTKNFGTGFNSSLQGQFKISEFPSFTNILQNLGSCIDSKIISLTTIPSLEAPQANNSSMNSINSSKRVSFEKPVAIGIKDKNRPNKVNRISEPKSGFKNSTINKRAVNITSELSLEMEKPTDDKKAVSDLNNVDTISESSVDGGKAMTDIIVEDSVDTISESSVDVLSDQYNIVEELTVVEEREDEKSGKRNKDVINFKNPDEENIHSSKPKTKILENVVAKPPNIVNEMKISKDEKNPADIKKSKITVGEELPSSSNQLVKDLIEASLDDFNEYLKSKNSFLLDSDSKDDEQSAEKKNENFLFTDKIVVDSEMVNFDFPSADFEFDSNDDNGEKADKNFL